MKSFILLLVMIGIWGGAALELFHYGSWPCLCIFLLFLVSSRIFHHGFIEQRRHS